MARQLDQHPNRLCEQSIEIEHMLREKQDSMAAALLTLAHRGLLGRSVLSVTRQMFTQCTGDGRRQDVR